MIHTTFPFNGRNHSIYVEFIIYVIEHNFVITNVRDVYKYVPEDFTPLNKEK